MKTKRQNRARSVSDTMLDGSGGHVSGNWQGVRSLPVCAMACVAKRFHGRIQRNFDRGLFISHHAYCSDALLLLPALLIIIRAVNSLTLRLVAGFLLTPLPFVVSARVPPSAPVPLLLLFFSFVL
jgi:hypothetical protein